MTLSDDDRLALEELERRLLTLLPEEYRDSYEDVEPVSMGSAGLVYASDGRVAWNAIWGSFCDLAMAGGPPHKGSLLEPAAPLEIDANRDAYDAVVAEICRGITLVTGLQAAASPDPGWVRVICVSDVMAGWLVRAISMENVAVRAAGKNLELPAGPGYRLEKEIKNVITVIAKTTHYWQEHMLTEEWQAIGALIEGMNEESPFVAPAYGRDRIDAGTREDLSAGMAAAIARDTGLPRSPHRSAAWLGVECGTVRLAVWMMRLLMVANVLARREHTALLVPINRDVDPGGTIVVDSLTLVHRLARTLLPGEPA
jgi:hypothetical protein